MSVGLLVENCTLLVILRMSQSASLLCHMGPSTYSIARTLQTCLSPLPFLILLYRIIEIERTPAFFSRLYTPTSLIRNTGNSLTHPRASQTTNLQDFDPQNHQFATVTTQTGHLSTTLLCYNSSFRTLDLYLLSLLNIQGPDLYQPTWIFAQGVFHSLPSYTLFPLIEQMRVLERYILP